MVWLTVKDIWIMRAERELSEMPLAKRIDQSFQRSISRWAAWRRKRLGEKAATAATTEAPRESLAA